MTSVYWIVIALGLVILFLGLLVVSLLKTQAEIVRRLDSLGIKLDEADSSAPISLTPPARSRTATSDIAGVDPSGDPVVKSLHVGNDPVLLAFLSTTCTSCSEFWESFDDDSMMLHEARYRVLVVTLGASEESPTRAANLSRGSVDVVMSSEAWADFEVPGAPYFAVVDPQSREVIGEGSAADMRALLTFLGDAAGDRRWDARRISDRTDADRERMIDDELKRAGIYPDDPRLYHEPGEGED
ncbi:MAG: hypothetical protein DWQ40_08555 [Actinobacteria bacterium]|nr:MAG: hypothetical protein DWQ40_08555 [Actinomycetota bacterium]